jgi:hypothetical protein
MLLLLLAPGVGMGGGGTPGQDGIDPYLGVPHLAARRPGDPDYIGLASQPGQGEEAGRQDGQAGRPARGRGWGRAGR